MFAGKFGFGATTGRRSRPAVLAVAACALTLALLTLSLLAPPLQAQINPFGNHPGGMTEAQQAAMGHAIDGVLSAGKDGATETWKEGNLGGTATVTKHYQKDGLSCAVVSHSFSDDTRNSYQLPFCKTDKGWKVFF